MRVNFLFDSYVVTKLFINKEVSMIIESACL